MTGESSPRAARLTAAMTDTRPDLRSAATREHPEPARTREARFPVNRDETHRQMVDALWNDAAGQELLARQQREAALPLSALSVPPRYRPEITAEEERQRTWRGRTR